MTENNTPAALTIGTRVTLSLLGRAPWTGTVSKVHPEGFGADLIGGRGALVSVVRNARNPETMTAIVGVRGYRVMGIAAA